MSLIYLQKLQCLYLCLLYLACSWPVQGESPSRGASSGGTTVVRRGATPDRPTITSAPRRPPGSRSTRAPPSRHTSRPDDSNWTENRAWPWNMPRPAQGLLLLQSSPISVAHSLVLMCTHFLVATRNSIRGIVRPLVRQLVRGSHSSRKARKRMFMMLQL